MSTIHDSDNVGNLITTSCEPPRACDQAISSTTPSSVSDQTASSTTPPSVSEQTTSSTTPPSVSEQTTSSTTSPSVSDQVTNNFEQFRTLSSVQHVESFAMSEYQKIVSADEQPDYLNAIDDDALYSRIIDDNNYAVGNGNKPDNAESHSAPDVQQQGYYSLTDDDDITYQHIADNEASNPQVDDQSVYNELTQAQTTGTSKAVYLTVLDVVGPQ
jgi:hypothetical protein